MNALALPKLDTNFTIPQPDLGKAMLTGQAIQSGQMKNELAQREIRRDEAITNALSGVSSIDDISPEVHAQILQKGGMDGLKMLAGIEKLSGDKKTAALERVKTGLSVADSMLPYLNFRDYPKQREELLKGADFLGSVFPPYEIFKDEADFKQMVLYNIGMKNALKREPKILTAEQRLIADGTDPLEAKRQVAEATAKGKAAGDPKARENQYTQTLEFWKMLNPGKEPTQADLMDFRKYWLGKGQDPEKMDNQVVKGAADALKNNYTFRGLDPTNPDDAKKAEEMLWAQVQLMTKTKGKVRQPGGQPSSEAGLQLKYQAALDRVKSMPDGPEKERQFRELQAAFQKEKERLRLPQ